MRLSWRRLGILFVIAVAFASRPFSAGRPLSAHSHAGCGGANNVGNNVIGVFELKGATGELKWVYDVSTGGLGRNGGYISIPQIVSTAPADGRACLFAANAGTHDISAFQMTIEHEPGTPCPCSMKAAGGPVSIGAQSTFGSLGAGLALTPDGKTLYSANPGSSDLSRFDVLKGCALELVEPRIAGPKAPADIQVKPDGRCLAVSSPETDSVDMYRIGPDHRLTSVGRFDVPGPGLANGLEFTSRVANDSLYVSKAADGQAVIVRFDVAPSCRLAARPSVTTVPTGRTSSLARLDPENRCLFAPGYLSSRMAVNHPPSVLTAFAVDALTGQLTPASTVDDVAFYPSGHSFGRTFGGERFLYYSAFTREIFRRPVNGCVPGAVVRPGVPAAQATHLPATGPLRSLTIVQ